MAVPGATWNQLLLERPPNARWHTNTQTFDISSFCAVLEKTTIDLESQYAFAMEAAMLSRLIYRMKSKFRNDKGLKYMAKINKCLLNYLSLSLGKEYKNLIQYTEVEGRNVVLPSRQMIEYVLVRTQGFAKLMVRLEEVARCSGYFFKTRMSSGHAWSISVVAYSVISRIWILSRHLITKCCGWYNGLYRYLKLFKKVGVNWLPKDQILPVDLKEWLALPWLNEPIPSVPSDEPSRAKMFKLITPRTYESDEESVHSVTNNDNLEVPDRLFYSQTTATHNPKRDSAEFVIPVDDTGEIVSRETFELKIAGEEDRKKCAQNEKHKNVKVKRQPETEEVGELSSHKVLTFNNVHSKSELLTILNQETYPGLDKLRWNMISKKAKKLINRVDACSNENKRSIILKKTIKRIQGWVL